MKFSEGQYNQKVKTRNKMQLAKDVRKIAS